MLIINGKEYKINMDLKWGTQKLMKKINDDPKNLENLRFLEIIVKDILIPPPTGKELFNFRNSDIERIFEEFADDNKEVNADFKKKLSQ